VNFEYEFASEQWRQKRAQNQALRTAESVTDFIDAMSISWTNPSYPDSHPTKWERPLETSGHNRFQPFHILLW